MKFSHDPLAANVKRIAKECEFEYKSLLIARILKQNHDNSYCTHETCTLKTFLNLLQTRDAKKGREN